MRLILLAVLLIATPAFAQTTPPVAQQPGGNYDLNGAVPSVASKLMGSSADSKKWTAEDVASMCNHRWPSQPKASAGCVERNKGKIGRPETEADEQELDLLPHAKPATMTPGNAKQP